MSRLGSDVSIESVEAPGSQGVARAKYRAYSTEAQRSEAGCIGARMQHDFRDGTLDMSQTIERVCRSQEETMAFAHELAAQSPDRPCYYLEGDLGAGKTVFAKGLASYYGIEPSRVVSPTFALVHRHSGGSRLLYHLDLYRIESEQELAELGIEELEEEGALLVIEWAERLGRYRREDAAVVTLEHIQAESSGEEDTVRSIRVERHSG